MIGGGKETEMALARLELGSDLVYHDLYKISKLPILAKPKIASNVILSCI